MKYEARLVRKFVLPQLTPDGGRQVYYEFWLEDGLLEPQPDVRVGSCNPHPVPADWPDTGPIRQAYNRPPYLSGWKPGDPPLELPEPRRD